MSFYQMRFLALFAIIFLAAAAVRLAPVEYGKPGPGYFFADEIDTVSRALKFASGDLMPLHFNKPTGYVAPLAGAYGFWFVGSKLAGGFSLADFEREFFLRPFPFYRIARIFSALAALATLGLLLYFTRGLSSSARLAGMAILAFAPSSVFYAHTAKEDPLAALWTQLAFGLSVGTLKITTENAKTRSNFLLMAAFFAGLAVSTKYNCFFAALFPLGAWMRMPRKRKRPSAALFLAVAAMGAFGFFLTTPYPLLHPLRYFRETLNSDIVQQAVGSYQYLIDADRRGLGSLGRLFWREFQWELPVALVAVFFFARRRGPDRWIALIPCALYTLLLAFSNHSDAQYILPLTPILCLMAAHGFEELLRIGPTARRLGAAAFCLALLPNLWTVARRTAEFAGEDTRLAAAKWLDDYMIDNPELARRPILIAANFPFHYYPDIAFDQATYKELLEKTRTQGGAGGYYERAAKHAPDDPRPQYRAEFLDINTSFQRMPDGTRVFPDQRFSLHIDDFRGRFGIVIVPPNTRTLIEIDAPELADLKAFLAEITSLPLIHEFHPTPWRGAGPSLWVYRME